MDNKLLRRLIDIAGRVCLSAVFVIAIPAKLTGFPSVVNAIVARGIPQPLAGFLLVVAIACLITGSGLLIFGKNQKIGASLLLTFIIPTTLIFHLFPLQLSALLMNLGLIGGLTLALTRPKLPDGEW